jgi:tetratricopeptide (TPR) repeat protein
MAKIRRNKHWLVVGLVLLLATGIGIGLAWTPLWQWWGRKAPHESVRDHWEQAVRASDEGDLDMATVHLEALLAICPLNARAHFLMARTCRRGNDPAGRQYLFLAESLGWPHDQIVLEQRLGQAESGDTWSVEEPLFDELNRLTSDERVILEALVKGYLNSARLVDAAEFATTWLKRYPDDWQAYLYRGRAYQGLSRLDEAIADYQHVLKMRPNSKAANLWFADAQLALNNYQSALELYHTYRKLAADDRESLLGIAKSQFALGQPEAQATVQEFLDKNPQHPGGLLLAARIEIAAERPDKALPHLQKAVELGNPDPAVLQALIGILRKLNRNQEADQLEKRYTVILEDSKQLGDLIEKIHSEPGDASLRYQAGMLALELGNEKEAMTWFQTVFYIDPGHRSTHLALADYWSKHGEPQQAAYHRRRAEGKQR